MSESMIVDGVAQVSENQFSFQADASLVKHYQEHFYMRQASTPELKESAYMLRHRVYGEELNQIPTNDSCIETDQWDPCAIQALLFHRATNQPIGNFRLVRLDTSPTNSLPIEKYYQRPFDFHQAPIKGIREAKIAEVTRFLIRESFRRRQSDSRLNVDSSHPLSSFAGEWRFPVNYLPTCLMFATMILLLDQKQDYGVCLMEPRLARLCKRSGIALCQIGDTFNHHGQRAPYLLFPGEVYERLDQDHRALWDAIQTDMT